MRREDYVPVLPLDSIVEAAVQGSIAVLSVDAEGPDGQVLCSGSATLERTLFVVVEANTAGEADEIKSILSPASSWFRRRGPT